MLSELSIENFAIIDRLLVRFFEGFTVLTGETGAGKSIIVDALQASLGAKVPPDVVRAGAPFAALEAVFDPAVLDEPAVSALLRDHGIEDDDCLILRREVSAGGRSSARINGRAVPLALLASVGARLVDIHGQSDHLSVLRSDRQLDVLDRYGGLTDLRARVGDSIRELTRLQRTLLDLAGGQRESEQRLDLLRFQVSEIEGARLVSGEEDELDAERNLLANAERLTQLSETAVQSLHGESGAVLDVLAVAEAAARELADINPGLAGLSRRLQSARYELEDIAQELRSYRDSVEYDPQRLDQVEERLDLLARLRRKYGPTIEDVIAFGARARASMEDVENLDERIAELERDVQASRMEAASLAADLSEARMHVASAVTVAMRDALQGLGLKGTSFEAAISRVDSEDGLEFADGNRYAFSGVGVDNMTFLVSFNPGEPLRPLEKVASGGETSRFLLALKSVLAESDRTPTLVFDEVDVGVGGRHGSVVGDRLRSLSATHQVLSITHLPQVAALADHHITVVKSVENGRTGVGVRLLDGADRVAEIAEMMSGTGTQTARRNARELLEAAQRSGS